MLKQRTTVILNQDYLQNLKRIALNEETSVTYLVNQALGRFIHTYRPNRTEALKKFLTLLKKIKKGKNFTKEEILSYVREGRK